MKTASCTRYGPPRVLEARTLETPTPGEGEVLVKIHTTTVTAGDCEIRGAKLPWVLMLPMRLWLGWFWPKRTGGVLGTELAGEVAALGGGVDRFAVGDRVFGSSGLRFGANAQYICVPAEEAVVEMAPDMTYDDAAAIPFGGRDALHFMRKGAVQRGERLLINGAGGSIGTFAVQLAKDRGAEVTAVDSGDKLAMLEDIGADHVVDYTREDFTRTGEVYDTIFDVVGTVTLRRTGGGLKGDGRYLLANPNLSQITRALWLRLTSQRTVVLETASGTADDLELLKGLWSEGKLEAVVDRTYPLEDIVAAHEYVETGRKAGNLVITVSHD